jgi:hypothetical protein
MEGLDFLAEQDRAYQAGLEAGRSANGFATLLTGVVVGALGTAFWFLIF